MEHIIKIKYNHLYNLEKSEIEEYRFPYDNNKTFKDLKEFIGLNDDDMICITVLNKVEGVKYYFETFDYIVGDEEIIWKEPINNVLIDDFVKTFGIDYINVENIIGGVGGGSLFDVAKITFQVVEEILKELWKRREEISYIYTLYEIFNNIKDFIQNVTQKNGKDISAQEYFYAILIQDDWSIDDFCKRFNCNSKHASEVLELLGYRFNKSKNLYHLTSKARLSTVKLINAVSNNFNYEENDIVE